MNALAATGVTRRFGSLVAVDGVSLAVAPGEVIGLVGANGAGKTTLIRVLLGLLPADAGTVELVGGPPSRETRRRVGYVPQALGLWPDLTVSEHLDLVRAVYDVDLGAVDDEAIRAIADRPVGTLPLGLRRRAAFAVALSHRPDVLVLDEPTSGVDPLARQRLWEVIRRACDAGAGALVSTHYLEEAARCDRVVLLAAGRVAAAGTVGELIRGRSVVEVLASRWEEAWRTLEAAGLSLLPAGRALRVSGVDEDTVRRTLADVEVEVTTVPATLEEVFLDATVV